MIDYVIFMMMAAQVMLWVELWITIRKVKLTYG